MSKAQTFTVTISVTQEELEKLSTRAQLNTLLTTANCFVPTIADTLAVRVLEAAKARHAFVEGEK